MWLGVTKGLAGVKFSGSVRELGVKNLIVVMIINSPKIPIRSLEE